MTNARARVVTKRVGSDALFFVRDPNRTNVDRKMYSSSGVYDSFDRFGRTLKFAWKNNVGTVLDQADYTYDYVGNRLSRDVRVDLINGSYPNTRDQKYTYDGLHRLQTSDQGTLSGGAITSSNQQRYWELDQLGNWPKLRDGLTGTSTVLEERTHNAVNELTGFTLPISYADPAYDAAGNMTTMPQAADSSLAYTLKYDAWNRLMEVIYVETTVTTMEYDGLGQRIRKVGNGTYDYYYNDQWQLLTEVKNGTDQSIYHWHPFYIDALGVRMRAGDTHFFLQDANFNVTAAVDDATNAVVERYAYSPYGDVAVLDADFSLDSSGGGDGLSDIGNTHFFTGRERDPETGLQLNRNRSYSSWLGRWLTRDPVFYSHSEWNLYQYVRSIPVLLIDPKGTDGYVWPGVDEDPPGPPAPDPGPVTPLPSTSPECNKYPCDESYLNANLRCFCKCGGDSPWSQYVRGCLRKLAEQIPPVPTGEAHELCYAAASDQHLGKSKALLVYCWARCGGIGNTLVDIFGHDPPVVRPF